jgi:hypothetical protein
MGEEKYMRLLNKIGWFMGRIPFGIEVVEEFFKPFHVSTRLG